MAPNLKIGSMENVPLSPPQPTRIESNSLKKSGSIGGGIAKIIKHRASYACHSCRARKIRCNVAEGIPCANCRWYNVECMVQETRRSKKGKFAADTEGQDQAKARSRYETRAACGSSFQGSNGQNCTARDKMPLTVVRENNANGTASDTVVPLATNALRHQNRVSVYSSVAMVHTSSGVHEDSLVPGCMVSLHTSNSFPQQLDPRPHLPRISSGLSITDDTLGSNDFLDDLNNDLGTAYHATPLEPLERLHPLASIQNASQLPPFLRPTPSIMSTNDVGYLQLKGALTLPDTRLQNALLQAFVECIHPFMPMLDLHSFLSIVSCRNGYNGQISLLLYHAVLFAATTSVQIDCLRVAGYADREDARKAFFRKTRLLYDFDYETDRLVVLQSLLLMTYWYDKAEDQKNASHWMDMAISLAHTIGLHRASDTGTMTTATRKLRKRIWWSCYMRERLIALRMRKLPTIADVDFNVPMLTENDFEIQTLVGKNNLLPAECIVIRDVPLQRELAALCIYKAKLCIIIGQMLKAHSAILHDSVSTGNTLQNTTRPSTSDVDNTITVQTVYTGLCAWVDSLPERCQYRPLTLVDSEGGHSAVTVHRTLLHMAYQSTVSALHWPQLLVSSPTQITFSAHQMLQPSHVKARDSALQVTRMVTELHHLRLERYLSVAGTMFILPAIVFHLSEMNNTSKETYERAFTNFHQCMLVMEKLPETCSGHDFAKDILLTKLRKALADIGSERGKTTTSSTIGSAALVNELSPTNQTPASDLSLHGQRSGLSSHVSPTESQAMANHQDSSPSKTVLLSPHAVSIPALELANPPQTDFEAVRMTPNTSGLSWNLLTETGSLDTCFTEMYNDVHWGALMGTDYGGDSF